MMNEQPLDDTIMEMRKNPNGCYSSITFLFGSNLGLGEFKTLQPKQTMLIRQGVPFLFRWHKVRDLKMDNVRLALDSAIDDFLWRPYVRYADKCGLFHPNDEILVSFMNYLDKKMLPFVTCLRVSELVGFDAIEHYLPHRVAMQFEMDQDVPSYVPKVNETVNPLFGKTTSGSYISNKNMYFPAKLFEADVTMRYAKWWKQSVLGHGNLVKNIVKRRSESSCKHRQANISGNDVDVPIGFPPKV